MLKKLSKNQMRRVKLKYDVHHVWSLATFKTPT